MATACSARLLKGNTPGLRTQTTVDLFNTLKLGKKIQNTGDLSTAGTPVM
jgi:hypothetical protein